jgi:hypothetical protein
LEATALANGELIEHPKGSRRWNAQRLLMNGEVPAVREIADRLDGKVPQAVAMTDPSGEHQMPFVVEIVRFGNGPSSPAA